MRNKIKLFFSKDLVKVFSLTSMATLIKMITSLVSYKIVAVLIGPSGVALIGQLQNIVQIVMQVSTGGIANGVVKYTSQYKGDEKLSKNLLNTSFSITLYLSVITGLVLIIFSRFFSTEYLHDIEYSFVIILLGLTISLYAFNTLFLSILNGYKEYTKFVSIRIVNSLVGLVFTLVLVYFMRTEGALLAIVSYQSVVLIYTLYSVRNTKWFNRNMLIGVISKPIVKKLLSFSLMAMVSAVLLPITQILIRNFITSHLSLEEAGIWEGMLKISRTYLMVITFSLSTYYLPKFSETIDDVKLGREIKRALKAILPFLLGFSVIIFVMRGFIVELLFSKTFLPMKTLFLWQLTGDFFKIASWILSVNLLAKAMTKTYIITEVLFAVFLYLITIFCVNLFGLTGATVSYAIVYLFYTVTMVLIFKNILWRNRSADFRV